MNKAIQSGIKRFCVLIGAFALGAAPCSVTWASPIVLVSIEAQLTGSADPFSSTIQAVGGMTYDFRVRVAMAPLGTSNSTGAGATINSLTYNSHAATGDGIANLKFDLFENAGDPIQLNIPASGTLATTPVTPSVVGDNVSWSAGTGANGGTLTARSGGTGNDLLAIRPVHGIGVQTADSVETLLTGQFTLPAVLPQQTSSLLQARWSSGGAGVFKINGGTSFPISSASEAGTDSYVRFTPLAIGTPEPASLAFFAIGGLFLLKRRRPETRVGNVEDDVLDPGLDIVIARKA